MRHSWQKELTETMEKMGYSKLSTDHSVFFRCRNLEHSIVALTTDDIAVTGNSLMTVKSEIKEYYDITDLGEI